MLQVLLRLVSKVPPKYFLFLWSSGRHLEALSEFPFHWPSLLEEPRSSSSNRDIVFFFVITLLLSPFDA